MTPNRFVAFPVSVHAWLAELQAAAPEGLRWFAPIDLHGLFWEEWRQACREKS